MLKHVEPNELNCCSGMKALHMPVHQWLQRYVFAPASLNRSSANIVARALNGILVAVFQLHVKTTDMHLQLRGARFRDCQLLLNEQADQLYAMTDLIADRVHTLGGAILQPFNLPNRRHRVLSNLRAFVQPIDVLAELREYNQILIDRLQGVQAVCEAHLDIATASMIDVWIDEAKRRSGVLFEADFG